MAQIVITGGSGLLGRALLARWSGRHDLTVISRSEKMQVPLRAQYPGVRWILGDIRDRCVLTRACAGQDLVLHAAALKHVPISESDPTAYASINVQGSIAVIEAAMQAGAHVLGISTDKACAPVNVYGMTKALMERALVEHHQIAIRYGNVFASDGSVIPLWRQQLAATGVITVTDLDMTRFLCRIEDAVDEIEWAMDQAPPGTVTIPAWRSASLGVLAEAFLAHAGRGSLHVTGPRPGEKPHESLLSAEEARYAASCGGRFVLQRDLVPSPPAAVTSDTAPRLSREELIAWLG